MLSLLIGNEDPHSISVRKQFPSSTSPVCQTSHQTARCGPLVSLKVRAFATGLSSHPYRLVGIHFDRSVQAGDHHCQRGDVQLLHQRCSLRHVRWRTEQRSAHDPEEQTPRHPQIRIRTRQSSQRLSEAHVLDATKVRFRCTLIRSARILLSSSQTIENHWPAVGSCLDYRAHSRPAGSGRRQRHPVLINDDNFVVFVAK